jgi:hypothetical protein
MPTGRVLFIDGDTWEPFGQMAAALRRHGVTSDHLTVPPRHWQSRYAQALESTLFHRTSHSVRRGRTPREPSSVPAGDVTRWVAEDTLDIQARDDLGYQLLNDASFPLLHHARSVQPGQQIYDKWFMTNLASQSSVHTPASWTPAAVPGHLDSAVTVVKSPVGFGGQGVLLAQGRGEREAAVADLRACGPGEPFVQEFVGRRMVNVAGVAEHGELLVGAAYRPVPPRDDPLGPPSAVELVSHVQASEAAARLVAATGFHGIFTIDFMLDPHDRALFIDFNPRVFGAWSALQVLGVDILGAYLRTLGLGTGPSRSQAGSGRRAGTLGPPPVRGPMRAWWSASSRTVSALQGQLGRSWAWQARARLAALGLRSLPGRALSR